VAIRLDEAVRGTLGGAIEGLRRVARDVAWVVPENVHLTLKFLGRVREARTAELVAALAQATSGFARFDASVVGLGAFPTPLRARVIWAGVGHGADALVELAGRVDAALAALGFERDPRPFSPHVTLGRVRAPRRDPALADALSAGVGREFGRLPVERVALMRSDLSPRGARYTELGAARLV
jgi:RNA 2',3'-cyclic 3'-phosphodiesterase